MNKIDRLTKLVKEIVYHVKILDKFEETKLPNEIDKVLKKYFPEAVKVEWYPGGMYSPKEANMYMLEKPDRDLLEPSRKELKRFDGTTPQASLERVSGTSSVLSKKGHWKIRFVWR